MVRSRMGNDALNEIPADDQHSGSLMGEHECTRHASAYPEDSSQSAPMSESCR